MKTKTKVILIISAVVVCAALAVLIIVKPFEDKTVSVYPVSSLMSTDYSTIASELSGSVREEGYQSIYLSDSQQVNEIYVQTGQHVEPGDVILSYDTTLTDLELQKTENEISRLKVEIAKAQSRLNWINSLVPYVEPETTTEPETETETTTEEPETTTPDPKPVKTPYFVSGDGTKEDPLLYLIDAKEQLNEAFFREILPEETKKAYVVLEVRTDNSLEGKIEEAFGFLIIVKKDELYFRLFTPYAEEDISEIDDTDNWDDMDDWDDWDDIEDIDDLDDFDLDDFDLDDFFTDTDKDYYTAAEIAKMRSETEAKIRDLTQTLRIQELEYQKQVLEYQDTAVRAKEAGTVTSVLTPEAAAQYDEPLVRISSGGGLFVDVYLGELSLNSMKPGETVKISSLETQTESEGTVVSISDVPVSDNYYYYYSDGNSNVSYYPVTISIPESAKFEEGDYVNVTTTGETAAENSFFLENMFIRNEKGHTFVFVDNNGKLEKREIKAGKNLYGYSTQIKEGLSGEDYIAFPFGKKIKEGAPTRQAGIDELYK